MSSPSVVILGGGLAGVATAYTLVRSGVESVTILERGGRLGGLAGSFERDGHVYPLGYHHILHRDRTLLFMLDLIGALSRVRWRRIRMLFRVGNRNYNLGAPGGFLRFPMPFTSKLRFVRLMLTAFRKSDWTDWLDRSATELIDCYADGGARHAVFEPLTQLRFEESCDAISGAWLGARLHFREGSAALGYIPDTNWTTVLCDGLTRLLRDAGVTVRLNACVRQVHFDDNRFASAELDDGERVVGDLFVSTLPTEVYLRLVPRDQSPYLREIRYSALISTVCTLKQRVQPDFYWMNLASLRHHACGIFNLSSLNPSIGAADDTCINFVTHLRHRERPFYRSSDQDLLACYARDFKHVFGLELSPSWSHTTRLPLYAPVFVRGYRNPPIRSETWRNVYFAGNYRTYPSIASTGTAMESGIEAGAAILREQGRVTDLPGCIASSKARRIRTR